MTTFLWVRADEEIFFTYKCWICFILIKAAEPTECEYFSSPSRSVKHWWEWSIVTMAHCNVSVILLWCFYFTLLGEGETHLRSSPALFSRCLVSELTSTSGGFHAASSLIRSHWINILEIQHMISSSAIRLMWPLRTRQIYVFVVLLLKFDGFPCLNEANLTCIFSCGSGFLISRVDFHKILIYII